MKRLLLVFLVFNSTLMSMDRGATHEYLSGKEVVKDVIGALIVNFLEKKYYIFHIHRQVLSKDVQHIKSLMMIQTILSAQGKIKPLAQAHKDEALFYSVMLDNPELVKLFLSMGANPNAYKSDNKWIHLGNFHIAPSGKIEYPIFEAVGKPEILKLLLEYGANPNLKTGWGLNINTPLIQAVSFRNIESLKLLLAGVVPIKKIQELEQARKERTSYLSLLPPELLHSQVSPYLTVGADLKLYNQGRYALDFAKKRLNHYRRSGHQEFISNDEEIIRLLEEKLNQ